MPENTHQADTDSAVLVGRREDIPFSTDDTMVKAALESKQQMQASEEEETSGLYFSRYQGDLFLPWMSQQR